MKVGSLVKPVAIGALALIVGLWIIGWGKKNDVPGLTQAADVLDQGIF